MSKGSVLLQTEMLWAFESAAHINLENEGS